MKNRKIQEAILALLKPKLEENELTIENVARGASRFLFGNIWKFLDKNGKLVCSPKHLPEEIQQCIESWEVVWEFDEDGKRTLKKFRVRCVSKIAVLSLVLKYRTLLAPNQTNNDASGFDWGRFYRAQD